MLNPIVIDEEEEEEDLEATGSYDPPIPPTSGSSRSLVSTSSSTPHIIDPTRPSTFHQRGSHHQAYGREGGRRSVVVKRRLSSTTEGGVETSHECCNSLDTTAISITTISADDRHTTTTTTATPLPVPVITEYAPSLPYLSAPLLPYLALQPIPTVLASSDNPLSSSGGGDHFNVDDLQHLPTLNCEFRVMCVLLLFCCCVVVAQTESQTGALVIENVCSNLPPSLRLLHITPLSTLLLLLTFPYLTTHILIFPTTCYGYIAASSS